MASTTKSLSFGELVRERRRQLHLTQEELAPRAETSAQHVCQLESGRRRPSRKMVSKLADVLRLDGRELFLLAYPGANALLSRRPRPVRSAWDEFRKSGRVRRVYSISDQEIELLSRVAAMGEVSSPRDFLHILVSIRLAVGRDALGIADNDLY
jgi:transcriptional regulator with XRE-family HTH domain